MNKYQEALEILGYDESEYWEQQRRGKKFIEKYGCCAYEALQELVDKETPLTPTFKNIKVEREHYLDKDYQMLYHCPKCDSIVYPISRCEDCGQRLDWNKYFIIEGNTYYKRSDNDE